MLRNGIDPVTYVTNVSDACCYQWSAKSDFTAFGENDAKLKRVLDAFSYEGYPIKSDEPPIYRCQSKS